METTKTNVCELCVNAQGKFKGTTSYTLCPEFNRLTSKLRDIWNRYHLDNYYISNTKSIDDSPSVISILNVIQLLDENFNPLKRETGTEPWLDAIESLEEAILEELDDSDSCIGCSITTHTGESDETLEESEIEASTIHLVINIFK